MPWYRLTHIETFEETYAGSLDGIGPEWVAEEISGEPPVDPGYVLDETLSWELPMETLRTRCWKALQAKRERVRAGGCSTPKGRMQNDPASQAKLTSTVVLAEKIPGYLVQWKMEDNSLVPHDAADLLNAGIAMGQYDAQVFGFAEQVRASLQTMTREELEAFNPEELAWPQ